MTPELTMTPELISQLLTNGGTTGILVIVIFFLTKRNKEKDEQIKEIIKDFQLAMQENSKTYQRLLQETVKEMGKLNSFLRGKNSKTDNDD
jgi:hypothetical protein